MKREIDTPSERTASPWRKRLWILAFIAAVGSFVWVQLPDGGYPTDLTRIGAGRPTLVLAHDSNYTGGMTVMALMNEIRHDYADRVDFLVAHLGMADGQAFARRHGVRDGAVVIFSGDGQKLGVIDQPRDTEALRRALNEGFDF